MVWIRIVSINIRHVLRKKARQTKEEMDRHNQSRNASELSRCHPDNRVQRRLHCVSKKRHPFYFCDLL